MPKTLAIRLLKRVTALDGSTLHFMIPGADRQNPPQFIPREDVPPFEGPEAWFELEKIYVKPWPRWKVVRRVEGLDGQAL